MQANSVLESHEIDGNTLGSIVSGAILPERPPRRRFWEIDCHFKCPVVGMCLALTEQKQLLKKTGIAAKRKGPFEIHEILVGHSETENPLSRKMDSFLSSKYGREAKALEGLGEDDFLEHWRSILLQKRRNQGGLLGGGDQNGSFLCGQKGDFRRRPYGDARYRRARCQTQAATGL